MIKKVKNTVLCTYVIQELNKKEIVRKFYEKELPKTKKKKKMKIKKINQSLEFRV